MSAPDSIDRLDRAARRERTPCGEGDLAWRIWGDGPPLLLLHGGAGSWRHWLRNVDALAARRLVLAPDLPGLGDSADPPGGFDAADLHGSTAALAAIVDDGLRAILGASSAFEIVGFSLGSIVGGCLAAHAGERASRLVLVGATSLGLPWGGIGGTLRSIDAQAPFEATREAHRHNLGLVMLSGAGAADDLALRIQHENVRRARIQTFPLADGDVLRGALPRVRAAVHGVWGDRDPYALPDLDLRGRVIAELSPGASLHTLAGAGHWAMYERAEAFDALLARLLDDGV